MINIVKIIQAEADYLIKNIKDRKLIKASAHKKCGGKTYYVKGDDYSSLNAIAILRGYKPIKKVYYNNGKKKVVKISPIKQLLNDN